MKEKIIKILKDVAGVDFDPDVFVPENGNFGHYSTNIALRLAAKEKNPLSAGRSEPSARRSPLDLAKELALKIWSDAPAGFFDKVEAAPPGFINFWLKNEVLQNELRDIYRNAGSYGRSDIGQRETIIVEYSQPNIAKKMHVGHLRTTIIGDALANIFEFLGYKVVRWNYLGDWGTQFGRIIAAYKLWGNIKAMEADPIEELQRLYVRFHEELKNNPELEGRGQKEFKKLEEDDKENRKLWGWFKEKSVEELRKAYKVLGVEFDEWIGESFFEKDLAPLIEDLQSRGIARESAGALIVNLGNFHLPTALVRKSDGASLYLTRDIANLRYRLVKYRPAKILYVVGNEQALHFEQLFAIAKIMGLGKAVQRGSPQAAQRGSFPNQDYGGQAPQAEFVHVKYGLVLGEAGKKLATREGQTILLEDVLRKAIDLARDVVDEKSLHRYEDSAKGPSDKERREIAEVVGVGALKYNDLKENRMTDIVFDWKKMLDLTGDSAPYLQYTYARLMSIKKKAGEIGGVEMQTLNKETELELIRKIIEFPDEVLRGAKDLGTSNLAGYLYKLAVLANRLYETTPVIKEENELRRNALLMLVVTAATVLKKGLGLLGIKTLEEI